MYNMVYKISATESVQNGRFASHAKRLSKYPSSLRRKPLDSLRWNAPDSSFLQEDRPQETNPEKFGAALSSRPIPIPFFRTYPGLAVCYHHGIETHQQDRNPAIQRLLPGDSGIEPFPGPNDFEDIPEAAESPGDSSIGQTPRQPPGASLGIAPQTPQSGLRFGLRGNYYIRKTARGPGRLQSQEAGKAFLSSFVLFRSSSSGILARNSATGQRCLFHQSSSLPEGLPGKSPARHRQKPDSFQDGFGVLQPEDNPVPRRYGVRICHRSQGISHYQSQSAEMPVPKTEQWLGDWGIQRKYPSKMGKPTQVYRNPAPYPGRSPGIQTTDFVQRYQICLSYFRDQSQDVGLESVSVLQSQSHYRKEQSRIHLRLSAGQNSQQLLESQCGVLPIASVFRKYSSLVQKAVSAQRVLDV